MAFATENLAGYLGAPVSRLLSDHPFRFWTFERSVETDLPKVVIDYVADDEGMDFTADGNEDVSVIFLHCDKGRVFEGLSDMPFTSTRDQVLAKCGTPEKSGKELDDPIFGPTGAWDRFARERYSLHVQYKVGGAGIAVVTLMRPDMVP